MVTEGKAIAITGEVIEVRADSLCLHGDTPGAVELARALKEALVEEDVDITPLNELV
jgi:UPF0271 protein